MASVRAVNPLREPRARLDNFDIAGPFSLIAWRTALLQAPAGHELQVRSGVVRIREEHDAPRFLRAGSRVTVRRSGPIHLAAHGHTELSIEPAGGARSR